MHGAQWNSEGAACDLILLVTSVIMGKGVHCDIVCQNFSGLFYGGWDVLHVLEALSL